MELMQALDQLVSRARERLGVESDSILARRLGYPQDNYVASWRGQIRRGGQGPSFINLVPLLEAAGVFATRPAEAEELQNRREAVEAEIARLTAEDRELAEQQKRQRPDR
jgi:phage repressor protein C with HTH and peptisase S24 domain